MKKILIALCMLAPVGAFAQNFSAPNLATSITTTGTSGAATLSGNVLNIPQYQGAITLTTTGSSGAATLTGSTLNIPNYAGSSQTYPAAGIMVSTGTAFGTSLTAPAGTIVGTTDTQTLTNKTLDGVTSATMAFVDPTSSIQTQLNGKQATFGSQTANFFYAAPNGSAGTPTFRAIVAADVPGVANKGRAVLVAGTVTVSSTAVATTSVIELTDCIASATVGVLSVGTVTASTSFVVNSSSTADTSTVCWAIL